MRSLFFVFIVALASIPVTHAEIQMTLGDGLIDGRALEPYRNTWHQCAVQDGEWQIQSPLVEEFVVIDDAQVRLRQATVQASGVQTRADTYFDRQSLAPLRMEVEATVDGNVVAHIVRELDADGYVGTALRDGETTELKGSISSRMLHGGAMGLPLATMDYQDVPVKFVASMVSFDGTYDVIASWVGKEKIEYQGEDVEAWLIDVEWLHRESADVYAPGPDGSGGRYWVVHRPPAGFPYVPRYQTDTYAVEFVPGVCPADGD